MLAGIWTLYSVTLPCSALHVYWSYFHLHLRWVYATSTFPVMHLICHTKFCISIVFNFSWDSCKTQNYATQTFGGRGGGGGWVWGRWIRCIMGNEPVKWLAPSWLASWYWLECCIGVAEVTVYMPASLNFFRHSFQLGGFLNCDFLLCIILFLNTFNNIHIWQQ